MRKTYLRPAGLLYGPDAAQVVKEGRGASLGGLSSISYTLIERIERNGTKIARHIKPVRCRVALLFLSFCPPTGLW